MRAWLLLVLIAGSAGALVPVGCGAAERCSGGVDEDGDGLVDCDDPDCWVAGGSCAERCSSIFDEDGDGAVGCRDSDCWGPDRCPELCDRAGDEDGDGTEGCDDEDCWGPACEERCDRAGDEDGDGASDCEDEDCWGAGCDELCDHAGDEDGDGEVDCDDAECLDAIACAPTYSDEVRPILIEHCSGDGGQCHTEEVSLGGLSVERYDDMPKAANYCPGHTKGWCCLFRIEEPSMPQDCIGCVPDDQVAIIERWVNAGIPE